MSCIAKCCGKIPFEKIKFLECVQDGDLAGAEATYNEYEDKLKLLEFHDSHGRNAIHIVSWRIYIYIYCAYMQLGSSRWNMHLYRPRIMDIWRW